MKSYRDTATMAQIERKFVGIPQDQPFFSVSGAPGSASDLDIVLTNAACTTIVASGVDANVGGDPVEVFGFTHAGPGTTFGIIILRFAGPNPGLMKTVNAGSGSITSISSIPRPGPPGAIAPHSEGSGSARPITRIRPHSGKTRRSSRRFPRPGARPSYSTPPGTGSPHRRSASSRTSRRRTASTPRFSGVTRTALVSRTSSGPRPPPRMPSASPRS